jgi:hypothetical protein
MRVLWDLNSIDAGGTIAVQCTELVNYRKGVGALYRQELLC